MHEMYTWDLTGRRGNMPSRGGHVEVMEFAYSKTHVIYEQNGVRIRAWPPIHTIDGAVSYSLEWKGKKFVYSGDTVPNKWFLAEATSTTPPGRLTRAREQRHQIGSKRAALSPPGRPDSTDCLHFMTATRRYRGNISSKVL